MQNSDNFNNLLAAELYDEWLANRELDKAEEEEMFAEDARERARDMNQVR